MRLDCCRDVCLDKLASNSIVHGPRQDVKSQSHLNACLSSTASVFDYTRGSLTTDTRFSSTRQVPGVHKGFFDYARFSLTTQEFSLTTPGFL